MDKNKRYYKFIACQAQVKRKFFFLLNLLVAFISLSAQDRSIEELKQHFNDNQQVHEKLFVHTDKNFYLAGETLWFKVYTVNANDHTPIDISRVAYVEILNSDTKPLLQATIKLSQGTGEGSFTLPSSLYSGSYILRAYTNWMKNFDEGFFFQKIVTLVNTAKQPDWQSLEKKETYSVQFFPEGGDLVYDLQSKVGFHITDQYGKGVNGSGIIVDQQNDTVAHFQSSKFGIGNFYFTPRKEAVYTIKILLSNDKMITAALPSVLDQGYVMDIIEVDGDRIKISVSTNIKSQSLIYLLAHTRQEMKMALGSTISNGKADWIINKNKLGEGISNFLLFDDKRQPVCERLFFKRPKSKMHISVTSDEQEYKTRSGLKIEINTKDKESKPVAANLSMAVFLIDSLQTYDTATLDSYIWLTSELRGNIESPHYYFGNDNPEEINKAADNLMLTHGWRRFRWEEEHAANFSFTFLPEFESLMVSANLSDKKSGKPAAGVVSYLSFPGEKFSASSAVSDSSGRINFVLKNAYGANDLVLQVDSNSNRYAIQIVNPYSEKKPSLAIPRFALSEKWKDQLRLHHINIQIANSFQTIKARTEQYTLPVSADTTVFYGRPDKTYYLDDYTRFPTMEEVMRELVSEVRVRKENDQFHYSTLNIPYKLHFKSDPLVLFDGVPIFNINNIISFDPLKIKKIDVIARKYFWGSTINNGIISYTSYEGNLGAFEMDPATIILEFGGLQLKREFYQPDYGAEKQTSRLPDTRNVLYWQPALITDFRGKKELHFFSSDVIGNYFIVVQGITTSGLVGSTAITIKVKQP